MSNVLDVSFIWPLTIGLSVYVFGFGVFSILICWIVVTDIYLCFINRELPSSEEWTYWLISLGFFLFSFLWMRSFLPRILPGKVNIIAVKILKKQYVRFGISYWSNGTFYFFRGGEIARIIQHLPYLAPPVTLSLYRCLLQKLNFSKFGKKSHKILYLDEKRQIALAAEKCWGGGAVLLDENLTHLRLNKQEKQQLLINLHRQQKVLIQDPDRLKRIIEAIPEPHRVYRWEKSRRNVTKM